MTTPPHRVIYTHGAGRLGNQILRFAHWMAWAREHAGQVEVLDLAFWPYADYFALWREHPGCVFPERRSRADRLARRNAALPSWMRELCGKRDGLMRAVHATGRIRPGWQAISPDGASGGNIDLDDPAFLARVKQSAVTTCQGWRIASWRLFARHEAELRECFRPAPEFGRRAQEFMTPLRARYDVIAGLLIRQSDYRTWANGRFYFPTSTYVGWIRQLLDLHPGRRVAVVVASEERQDPALFGGLPCHFATGCVGVGGHWFENFAELALCDFVISAPSTFGAAAAFVGAAPLWPVVVADQVLALGQLLNDGMVGAARHPIFSQSVK
jgi:hypothetical protein